MDAMFTVCPGPRTRQQRYRPLPAQQESNNQTEKDMSIFQKQMLNISRAGHIAL